MPTVYRVLKAFQTSPGFTKTSFNLGLVSVLLEAGWTQIDVLNSTPGARDSVFKSVPLDATADNACYLRLMETGSNHFMWLLYTDWDTTLNVGANETGPLASPVSLQTTEHNFAVRANQHSVAVYSTSNGQFPIGYAGFLRRGLPASKAGCTKTTAPYAIGTQTMNVASDMTTKLKVGQKVLIYNHSGDSTSPNFGNAEALYIQSIAAGSITFTSATTKAFDTGAVIGHMAFPGVMTNFQTFVDSADAFTYYMPFRLNGTRVGSINQTAFATDSMLVTEANADPGDIYPDFSIGMIGIYTSDAGVTGFLGYPYHWENCTSPVGTWGHIQGGLINDGENKYLIIGINSTSDMMLMGPI